MCNVNYGTVCLAICSSVSHAEDIYILYFVELSSTYPWEAIKVSYSYVFGKYMCVCVCVYVCIRVCVCVKFSSEQNSNTIFIIVNFHGHGEMIL